jgi:hypothetical protein
MIHIRPHRVLDLVENNKRIVKMYLPNKDGPKCLESIILISLIILINPKMALEIGTYLGRQTFNLAAAMEIGSKIYTLDLDKKSFEHANLCNHDTPIALRHFDYEDQLAFSGTEKEGMIIQLFGDSKKFDFTPYYNKMNFIYIDGGHDIETLNSDTMKALRMVDKTNQYCICWHDYGNKNYEVTSYLDTLSKKNNIFHVEEAMICFHKYDKVEDIFNKLR